ncbi:hypothetical protein HW130_08375 [Streptomyces sp. PKU-EA00015]|uniref:hypothetical protein n=1 Tax=Streptomyces sp. PKU-EA00015 TaxID=2748326 RepID=UPI0015A317F3|nr:hypothetical protein [Streptomyces sp. PKU-EA00015]NWF26285.1 hypothetical protein [Streptomyces sp. PKU-EA00015]
MGMKPHSQAMYAAGTLLFSLAAAACSTTPSPGHPRTPTPAPQPSSPAQICTSLVSYWAKETLKGDKWAGIDWEQKGLSNDQYALHEKIVAAARTEQRRQGRQKALELIDRQAERDCAEQNGLTGSSENWRPPR